MIMQYPTASSATLTNTTGVVTTVDCQKQVRSWRLLRSLIELLIPSCNCTTFLEEESDPKEEEQQKWLHHHHHQYYYRQPTFTSTSTITGTIFGSRRGKVSFCIQSNHPKYSTTAAAAAPIILLLELAIPTATLAREMKGGLLRIALESCNSNVANQNAAAGSNNSLLSMPVWNMYCNGREAGLAVKRRPSKVDMEVLQHMESVSVGAGIISGKEIINGESEEDVLYMRGKYERIQGSLNHESFHLMDPDGNVGQELSFFFLRSH